MRLAKFLLYCACLALLFACKGQQHKAAEVEAAMHRYDTLIRRMDVKSIALIYAPDGSLGNVAHGRDSIEKFLNKFKDFKVLLQSSESKSVLINADTAIQKGTYRQIDVTPGKDTVKVKGTYTARWIWLNNAWYIKKMETTPVK